DHAVDDDGRGGRRQIGGDPGGVQCQRAGLVAEFSGGDSRIQGSEDVPGAVAVLPTGAGARNLAPGTGGGGDRTARRRGIEHVDAAVLRSYGDHRLVLIDKDHRRGGESGFPSRVGGFRLQGFSFELHQVAFGGGGEHGAVAGERNAGNHAAG